MSKSGFCDVRSLSSLSIEEIGVSRVKIENWGLGITLDYLGVGQTNNREYEGEDDDFYNG